MIAQLVKIFYFPYTALTDYTICWVEYFLSSLICIIMVYLLRKFRRISLESERNFFDWRVIVGVSMVLATLSLYEKRDREFS